MTFFSKKLFAIAVVCTAPLVAQESLPSLHPDEDFLSPTTDKSQFLYVAGGMNPFPTFSLGYRKLYSSFGSDLSISASAVPLPGGKSSAIVVPIPGFIYKQLFFAKKGWKGLEAGHSVFYWGLQTGLYPFTVNGGGLVGWQFKRKARSDFFEIGLAPFLYSNREFNLVPVASLTYAFMF